MLSKSEKRATPEREPYGLAVTHTERRRGTRGDFRERVTETVVDSQYRMANNQATQAMAVAPAGLLEKAPVVRRHMDDRNAKMPIVLGGVTPPESAMAAYAAADDRV